MTSIYSNSLTSLPVFRQFNRAIHPMSLSTKKIIIIFSLILFLIDVSHTLIDPTIAMCIDGEVDTAFLTRDGSTYIFMNSWFWKLNDKLDAVVGNASAIKEKWHNLPGDIETSFYVSGDMNRLNGKTFFVKNQKWYQFDDQDFEELGSTGNWTGLPEGILMALSQYNDPIVVFYVKHYRLFQPIGFYFDSPYFPESKRVLNYKIPFDTSQTEALISYSNGKYLIFFDDHRVGAHCIMNDAKSGCTGVRENRDLFECPDFTKDLFQKNLFVRVWFWTGLGLKQFGILVLGILISIAIIFLFILIILGLKLFTTWKRKSRKSSKHTETTVERNN